MIDLTEKPVIIITAMLTALTKAQKATIVRSMLMNLIIAPTMLTTTSIATTIHIDKGVFVMLKAMYYLWCVLNVVFLAWLIFSILEVAIFGIVSGHQYTAINFFHILRGWKTPPFLCYKVRRIGKKHMFGVRRIASNYIVKVYAFTLITIRLTRTDVRLDYILNLWYNDRVIKAVTAYNEREYILWLSMR